MKINYYNLADAMYIRYSNEKVAKTVEVWDAITDFDINGNIIWVEMIWVKSKFENNNIILQKKEKQLEFA